MIDFSNKLQTKFKNNKKLLFFCTICTFIIGMIAHSYMYYHDSFSHDCLNEFNSAEFGNLWKIQIGRFIIPAYKLFTRGNLTLPFLIGILSLLWVSIAVFFVVKTFNIQNKTVIAIIAGIIITNISVISNTSAYIHDLDVNMLSLMLSCAAVYLWQKEKLGFIYAIPFIFVAMGIYQSFISYVLTLMIIYLIVELFKGTKFNSILISGVKGIIAVGIGSAIYFIANKLIIRFTGVAELADDYHSMNQIDFSNGFSGLIKSTVLTFKTSVYHYLFVPSAYSKWFVLLLVIIPLVFTAVIAVKCLIKKQIGILELFTIVILTAIIPIAADVTQIISGTSHELTYYALWLLYLLPVLTAYNCYKQSKDNTPESNDFKSKLSQTANAVCCICTALIIISNIVVSNEVYLKKDLDQDSNLALFSNVIDRMETVENYDHYKTPVMFIGKPEYFSDNKSGFEDSYSIMGSKGNYVLGAAKQSFYKSFFEYKLNYKIVVLDEKECEKLTQSDYIKNMPAYPSDECIQIVDNILVVKLG